MQLDHDHEVLEHQTHVAELQQQREQQRQIDYDREALEHQAHVAEMQQQRQIDHDREVSKHQARVAEMQQQRQIDHDREVLEHQIHVAEMQRQRQINHDREVLEHQARVAEVQQQQVEQTQIEYEQEVVQHEQVVQQAIDNNQALMAIPPGCRPYQEPASRHSLGAMSVQCPDCHAMHFKSERLTNSSNIHPKFGVCCLQGQIQLPPFSDPPDLLHRLLTSSTPHARKFRESIRQYNSAFAFTSLAVNVDHTVLTSRGPYSFRIHGGLYHKMGALHPPEGRPPCYAQLYIYDEQAALATRNNRNPNLDHVLIAELQDMLNANNPFVPLYKQAYQIMNECPPEVQGNLEMAIMLQPGDDRRRYNLPTVDEVAAIIPGTGEEDVDRHRDIVLRYKHGHTKRMSHIHPLYHPLHYVLLFPKGDQGWHTQIEIVQPEAGNARSNHISQRCYFAFRLHPRPMQPSDLFRW